MHIGGGQQLLGHAHFPFLELNGLGPQHGVREVQVPGVRWGVGALGHVAQVAHVALVHHFPIILFVHPIDFQGAALVDQVKQGRKRVAQAHTTAATVADVKDALQLIQALVFVVEVRVLPVQSVPCGGFEVAFFGHAVLLRFWFWRFF
jgi:hypothetical protein